MTPAQMTPAQTVQFVLSVITLATMIFGVFKVVTAAQKGVDAHEKRIATLEGRMDARSVQLEALSTSVFGMSAKFDLLNEEMRRVRDRMDHYLDGQQDKAHTADLLLEAVKRAKVNFE
jgi:uncharacterized coiled-coil protein SlyX